MSSSTIGAAAQESLILVCNMLSVAALLTKQITAAHRQGCSQHMACPFSYCHTAELFHISLVHACSS